MADLRPVRIGLIGAGNIFRTRHLPNLLKIPGVELVSVANRTEASTQAIADEFDIRGTDPDWQKLLRREEIDAVMIGTWPYMHREISIAALEAGKHVFCQARMCNTWTEALQMYGTAKRHPTKVTMICPPPHRMPWEPYIKKVIGRGELGHIRAVEVISVDDSNVDRERVTWRERVEYSGLQTLQVGIWAEVLNAWIGEYDQISAMTATPVSLKRNDNGEDVHIHIPQVVSVQGQLINGAVITEHHNGLSLHRNENRLTIYGSRATLRVDAMDEIWFAKAGEPLEPVDVPAEHREPWRVEQEFVDAVRAAMNDEPWSVMVDFHEGLRYMRKVQAIHDSAKSGRVLDLPKSYPLPDR